MKLAVFSDLRWPAVRLTFNSAGGRIDAASRFGGAPAVPRDFDWPCFQDRPLDFVLQIDLGDIAHLETGLDLPRSGRLLFCYDTERQPWGFRPEDGSAARVVHIPANRSADLVEQTRGHGTLPSAVVTLKQVQTEPDAWSPWVDRLNLSADERFEAQEQSEGGMQARAQIGGHPFVVQNSMEMECELASSGFDAGGPEVYKTGAAEKARGEAHNWRLLLQIPSDEALNVMWGDGGFIYFWIKADALARRDFSRTWLILQCM